MTTLLAAVLFLAAQKKPPPPPPPSSNPLEGDRLLTAGWDKYQKSDYLGAMADFNAVIKIDARLARAYSNRGLCQAALRQFDKAMTDFAKAIELDPRHTYAFVGRGDVHLARRELAEAIEAYAKAIDTNPNHPSAHALQGIAWIESGDYVRAHPDFERAIRLLADAKEATSLYHRGASKFWTHDFEGALADLTKAIDQAPRLQPAYAHRGRTRLSLGKVREGLADLRKAVELDPKDAPVLVLLGDALYLDGSYADAVKTYRRAGEADAALEDAAQLRAWRAQSRAGEKDAAKADLESWVKKRKPRPDEREFKEISEFFLGTRPEELVLGGLDSGDTRRVLERRCERYLEAGIKRLADGDVPTASRYFKKAAETEIKDQISWVVASAELAAASKK